MDPEIKYDANSSDPRREALVEIRGDGRVLFAADVKAGDAPQLVELLIEGVVDLEILVDFGRDNSDIGDRIHLCDAKLVK